MVTEESGDTGESFFKGKRPWSRVKDTVLGSYMPPYLTKVAKLGRQILLIDCFAGPGRFDDGKPGSPLIMCQMAEKYAKGSCICLFVNKEKSHHEKLQKILEPFIQKKTAFPIYGDSQALLREVQRLIKDHTLFLYLDPFGLKGCEFGAIKTLLERSNKRSTEILINLSMPALHRLASRHAVAEGRGLSPQIRSLHNILDEVLGGDYWKKYMFDDRLSPDDKERKVMEEYRRKLKELLPYVGSCPVHEKKGSRIKYFITFCSRHPDTMVLMNDTMCIAYNDYIHEVSLTDVPLLAPIIRDWRTSREQEKKHLKNVITETIEKHNGRTRLALWEYIVQDHFMLFLQTEYRALTQDMVNAGELDSPTPRPTRRLNDSCILRLAAKNRN
jgi:three-Cys-motif partner protein